MAIEGAGLSSPVQPASPSGVMDKGLKKGAIGYLSNIVIGVASTAPAYSLATTLGFIVAVKGVGVHAPAVMLVAFVPMLLVAAAYKYFNRADPDAGTTFAWVTRAFGPVTGWMNGWAIFLADVIVMASLSDIAAIYTFKLFGFSELGSSKAAIIVAAVLWIAIMTWICYRGIELSARIQQVLLGAEVLILAVFSVVAFAKVYGSHPPAGSIKPSLSWINPFAMNFGDLVVALLLAVFIYWGWDSGVAVNEESENPAEGPGKAAVVSTVLLVLIYVVVTAASQSFHGTGFLTNEANQEDVLSALGSGVLGTGVLGKLLIIAVLTSASASTQTTILPTARTTLSMAHWKAVTSLLARMHKRYLTPTVSTLGFGVLSSHDHGGAAAGPRKRARRLDHLDRLPDLLLLRLHRRGVRLVLPPRSDRKRAQVHHARTRPADRRPDAVRRGDQGGDLLRPRRKRLREPDPPVRPRHHAAAADGDRRHGPRLRDHARLATVLPRVLLAQDRNRAARAARAAATGGADARTRGFLTAMPSSSPAHTSELLSGVRRPVAGGHGAHAA